MKWLLVAVIATTLNAILAEKLIHVGTYSEHNHPHIKHVPLGSKVANACDRTCVKGENMTCEYTFDIEWYETMSTACGECPTILADCFAAGCIVSNGIPRTVMVVNRELPGTSVDVCKGDKVIVNVNNKLMGETTSIHWHGHHQVASPYMDGAPLVSQCPIMPANSFKYEFLAENAGTHFWHSHTNMQRGDGVFGRYVVRVPAEENLHAALYDNDLSEHTMLFIDWDIDIGLKKYSANAHSSGSNKPSNILLNGLGLNTFETVNTPVARFTVEKGLKYRFRSINAGFLNCPIEISVDNHLLTVIATDGNDIQATEVTSIVSYAGERFDFIINADKEVDLYWIRIKGLMDCDERYSSAHQVAILQYSGTDETALPTAPIPNYENSHTDGVQLNALNTGAEDVATIAIPELKALAETDDTLKEEADYKFYIAYDFYNVDNVVKHKFPFYNSSDLFEGKQRITPQLNHISFKLPPFPVLPGRNIVEDDMLCNETSVADMDCVNEMCSCTQVIRVPLDAIVEIVMVDQGQRFDSNHPFHLHGHSFRVVGMERIGTSVTLDTIKEMDQNGELKRNLVDPPLKDTVTIPDGGYTILRLKASNPGYWLLHCHLEFHVEVGMALLFKFGEHSDMPDPPKDFPICGSYALTGNGKTNASVNIVSSQILLALLAILAFFRV